MKRKVYFLLGGLSVLVGVVGAFLPVLPTVPFLLLASYFFSRSSERFHLWLTGHPRWGPPIRDWEQHGRIRRNAKYLASLACGLSFAGTWILFRPPGYALIGFGSILILVLIFIWSRPEK